MTSSRSNRSTAGRTLIVIAVLGPWLLLIAWQQTALHSGAGGGPPGRELLPMPVTLAAMAFAVALRVTRASVAAHVACLVVVVCGLALLAASLGTPFANATDTYCGDFCRNAILARMVAFFGWPLIAAAGLTIVARADRAKEEAAARDRAAWSQAWIFPTLILGLAAAVAWSRIVLP